MVKANFLKSNKKCVICNTPFFDKSVNLVGKYCSEKCKQRQKRINRAKKEGKNLTAEHYVKRELEMKKLSLIPKEVKRKIYRDNEKQTEKYKERLKRTNSKKEYKRNWNQKFRDENKKYVRTQRYLREKLGIFIGINEIKNNWNKYRDIKNKLVDRTQFQTIIEK